MATTARRSESTPTSNAIIRENERRGTTGWKLRVLSYHGEISGYASAPSVQAGQTIDFSVSTTAPSFRADVYRMGWYQGLGARKVLSLTHLPGHLRKVPRPQPFTGLIVCRWPQSFNIKIPRSWLSGIYMVKLTARNHHQGYIPFTVTDPASRSTILMIHGVFTDEAYNTWGGKSLYTDVHASGNRAYADRAVKVSLQRPFEQSQGGGWFFSWEIHMVRWLEHNGYDVSYATDLDVAEHPQILLNHRVILIAGHDEYWTQSMRNGMDEAVRHGVSLGNFAANTGFWQVRLQNLGNEPDRVIVCYKTSRDPLQGRNNRLVTTEWRLPPVSRPESELTGAMYGAYNGNRPDDAWVVRNARSWVFKGAGVRAGYKIPSILGQEADTVVRGYPHPSDLQVVASSPFHEGAGRTLQAKATVYRASSGAWVFDAGTIDWSWGLDDIRQVYWLYSPGPRSPNRAAEVITENVLRKLSHS